MGWHPCSWYCLSLHGRHDGAHDIEPMTWASGPPPPCVGFPEPPWYGFMSMTTYGAATFEERRAATAYLEASAKAVGLTVEEFCGRMGYDLPSPPRKREAPGPAVREGETEADRKRAYAVLKADADRHGQSMDKYAKAGGIDPVEIHVNTPKAHVRELREAVRNAIEQRLIDGVAPPGLGTHTKPIAASISADDDAGDIPATHRISVRLPGDTDYGAPASWTTRQPIDLDRAIEVVRAWAHLTPQEWEAAWGISESTRRRWYRDARALILADPQLELVSPGFREWFADAYPAKMRRGRPPIKRQSPVVREGTGELASPPPIPLFPSRDDAA